ncbi:MAG: dephospho-CoA kinase [Clostridia bacterium]|nr:dephospho-CoA kinase [Clostridia bacterium]NLS84101.1 dephospho-CoA kinase [Oscillospiraceae bacterium]
MNIKTVAVTGRSGSGKSSVANYYKRKGYTVLDGDEAARIITETGSPCLKQLAAAFGKDILDKKGSLRRKELANRAFLTQESAKKLTDITHPAIVQILLSGAAAAQARGEKIVFVDGAVIVGAMFEKYCDDIIVVSANERVQLSRIMIRDNISKEAARERLSAQMSDDELRAAADYIIENNTTPQNLEKQAQGVLERLLDKYEKEQCH